MRRQALPLVCVWLVAATACAAEVKGEDAAQPTAPRRDAKATDDAEAAGDAGPAADDAAPSSDDAAAGSDDAAAGSDDGAPAADDASAPDAAPPTDAGPSTGSCAAARLCEDFESYPLGAAPRGPWTASTIGGTVTMDSTHAYSGQRSVRITTMGGANNYHRAYMELTGAPVFPLPANVMWGRMMMWVTEAPAPSVHWTNIEGEGPVPGRPGVRAKYRYGGQTDKRIMANYDTQGARTDCWDHSRTVMPEGRWACFEWHFDGPNDRLDLWLDSTALSDITVIGRGEGCIAHDLQDRWTAPTFDALRLGWEHYQPSIPVEIWIDDVAVDGARIGCP